MVKNLIHKIKGNRIPCKFLVDMITSMVLCPPKFTSCDIYNTEDDIKLFEVDKYGISVSYDLVWRPLEVKYNKDYPKIREVLSEALSKYTTFKFQKERLGYFP